MRNNKQVASKYFIKQKLKKIVFKKNCTHQQHFSGEFIED